MTPEKQIPISSIVDSQGAQTDSAGVPFVETDLTRVELRRLQFQIFLLERGDGDKSDLQADQPILTAPKDPDKTFYAYGGRRANSSHY